MIDGHTAYTGGLNLSDEYINKVERFGYWKDTGIEIKGEAVWSLTTMFLEMWNYINQTKEDYYKDMEPFCHISITKMPLKERDLYNLMRIIH